MANYKQQSVAGDKWIRANRVTITNPYQGVPQISFNEEEITLLSDGRVINSNAEGVSEAFADPAVEFALIDPATGEPTGVTASYGQVYMLLHSLYMALAAHRDAAQAA